MIAILFLSACSEEKMASSIKTQNADYLLELIDQRIDAKVPLQIPEWSSATVISVGTGNATVHLPIDPIGTNVVVQNPREISLEIGDEVSISKFGGLSNAIIDFRKDITLDDIFVDNINGVDDYKHGTEATPFKTVQYAVNRLSKNINGRYITINIINSSSSEAIVVDGFGGGGSLKIWSVDEDNKSLDSAIVNACTGCRVYLQDITFYDVNSPVEINYSSLVYISNCNITAGTGGSGVGVQVHYGANAWIESTTISNKATAIAVEYCSSAYSDYNSGVNNTYSIEAGQNSTVGKNGSQPAGTELAFAGSVIR
jgi:hypothetical protein